MSQIPVYVENAVLPYPIERRVEALEEMDFMIPGEIVIDKHGKLAKSYLTYEGFSIPLIEAYDNSIARTLPRIITSRQLRTGDGGQIIFKRLFFEKPKIASSGEPMTPKMARNRMLTYWADILADLVYRPKDGTEADDVPIEGRVFLGKIPVMVGSVLCHTRGKTSQELLDMLECSSDPGGYFIVKGTEHVVLIQEKLRLNRILVFVKDSKGPGKTKGKGSIKGRLVARMTTNTHLGSTVVMLKEGKRKSIRLILHFLGKNKDGNPNSIGVFSAYRMIGTVLDSLMNITAPEEKYSNIPRMLRMISQFTRPERVKKIWVVLQQSLIKLQTVGNDYEAIAKKRKMSGPLTEKTKNDLFNSLVSELFPQITVTPKPGETSTDVTRRLLIRKLEMLSIMLVRMAEVMAGLRPPDDRDDWANKRLETAARSIEQLFSGMWAEVVRKTEETLRSKNFTPMTMRSAFIHHKIITDNFVSSFSSKNWGIKGVKNSYFKENITDILKRDNILATYSHLRRINTPASRKVKRPNIRLVQQSQLGYVCPIETPEGETCLRGDEPVLLADGSTKRMQDLKDGDEVITISPETLEETSTRVTKHFLIPSDRYGKRVLKITSWSGRSIVVTDDHPFLTSHGWVPAGELDVKKHKVCIVPGVKPLPYGREKGCILEMGILRNQGKEDGCREELFEKYGRKLQILDLLPLRSEDLRLPILARLTGAFLTRGTFSVELGFPRGEYSLDSEDDAKRLQQDISRLGFLNGEICNKGKIWIVCLPPALTILLRGLGGREFRVPEWIRKGSLFEKREFLAGFHGGSGMCILWRDGKVFSREMEMSCGRKGEERRHFLNQIKTLMEELGVKMTEVKSFRDPNRMTVGLDNTEENVIRYMEAIGYRYATEKSIEGYRLSEYLKSGIYLGRKIGYEEWCRYTAVVKHCLFVPIVSINEEESCLVGDFTTEAETHTFIGGEGFCVHNCGLVKNMSIMAIPSIERDENLILQILDQENEKRIRQFRNPLVHDNKTPYHDTVFLFNGKFMGWCPGKDMWELCIKMRREGRLPRDVSIVLHPDGTFYLHSDGALPTRPLLIVDSDGELVIAKKNLWDAPFTTLLSEGCVEYIDAFEQHFIYLAQSIWDMETRRNEVEEARRQYQEAVELLHRFISEGKEEINVEVTTLGGEKEKTFLTWEEAKQMAKQAKDTLNELIKKRAFTHCELDPTAYLGLSASIVPMASHNQGPRNVFTCGQERQALGICSSNHMSRFDTTMKLLAYPSRPLFETQMNNLLGLNELPIGETVHVAIMTYGGYNQEDAIIFNKGSIERGLFRMIKYTTVRAIFNQGKGFREESRRPDPRPGEPESRYDALDKNGIPQVGHVVRQQDCIIGRVRIYDNGQVENASVYLGIGEGGIVDRVIVSKNEVKQTVIKVKIRQVRYPIIGDKFSPRSAQKGTIGLVMPEVDMPFVAAGPNAGLRPDIIINPHCIPSRMTLGFLIEMIASKLVLMTGERFNATTFRPFDLEALRQNLKAYGFNPNGTEVMINGMTGKLMKAEIYMGPCYYMALRHHVQDKLQMRSRGAINPISHQPVPGRSRIGGAGLRFGEMERDSLISHGASAMLLDRLMACSDAYRTVWCQTCGTIAISDAVSQTSMCRKCKDKGNFGNLTIPYVYKLLIHLLNGLGINVTHGLQVLEP